MVASAYSGFIISVGLSFIWLAQTATCVQNQGTLFKLLALYGPALRQNPSIKLELSRDVVLADLDRLLAGDHVIMDRQTEP